MPIGVEGQYRFTFDLGGRNDFLREEDLDHFTLIEDAGGALPSFEMSFSTIDSSILPLLNEGSVLKVVIEGSDKNGVESELFIVSSAVARQGRENYMITLRGLYNATTYTLNQRILITERQDAIKTIKDTVSRYFKVEFERDSSVERQCWVQHNISDRRFVHDCWMHANLPNSFPLIGITSDGTFRLRDARTMAGTEPSVEFGYNSGFRIEPTYHLDTASGFLNSQGGYGVEQVETELESDNSRSPVKKTDPVTNIFTMAPTLNRNADAPRRQLPPVIWSPENTNPNYWEAYRRNFASLAAYSATRLMVTIRNTHVPARVLDLAMFKDDEGGASAIESYSGLYIVTKVARTLARRSLLTSVRLVREGLNVQDGSLR